MKAFRTLTLLLLVARLLPAQSTAPPPATGSITGNVVLGDSNLPARMALVTLLPVPAADAGGKKPSFRQSLVQAGLDGAFTLPNILPGSYYVIAMKRGYSLPGPYPSGDFQNYDKAPQDVRDALASAFPPVTVIANRASTINIVLTRGAGIAGTVRFDDGEPDSDAMVSLLRKEKSGKWTEFTQPEGNGNNTDDQGNFRIAGLPPGEYLLRTTLALSGVQAFTPGMESMSDPDYRWDVYFGDGIRPRDAKTIKLSDGEESNGNIIEIPLARLHSIAGTVLNLETGAPIHRADIELHNADDDSICTATQITGTGQFRFPYVAEGEYTLKITGAADTVPGKDGDKSIRTYANASQPLIVKGESSGITIQLKPLPAAAVPTAP